MLPAHFRPQKQNAVWQSHCKDADKTASALSEKNEVSAINETKEKNIKISQVSANYI